MLPGLVPARQISSSFMQEIAMLMQRESVKEAVGCGTGCCVEVTGTGGTPERRLLQIDEEIVQDRDENQNSCHLHQCRVSRVYVTFSKKSTCSPRFISIVSHKLHGF